MKLETVHLSVFLPVSFYLSVPSMFSSFVRVLLVVLPSPVYTRFVYFVPVHFTIFLSCIVFKSRFFFFLSLIIFPSQPRLFFPCHLFCRFSSLSNRVPLPSPRPITPYLLASRRRYIPCVGIVSCLPMFAHNSWFPVSRGSRKWFFPSLVYTPF